MIRKWPFSPFGPFAEGADGDSEEGRPADVARKRFGDAGAARRHARKRFAIGLSKRLLIGFCFS